MTNGTTFPLAYIPRALNNRDVNDATVQMFSIGKWRVHKLSLWAEPEDINNYNDVYNYRGIFEFARLFKMS